jgi:hypothetical protein
MIPILLFCLSLAEGPHPEALLLRRDHGPGTSGGGLSTQSGEVMKPGAVSLDFRIDYTQFEHLSPTDIERRTNKVGGADHQHFDAARSAALETFSLSYGATENLQIGFSFGYYYGNDVREGHLHSNGSYGFHEFGDIKGTTDHWITAKYRVAKGEEGGGSFSVLTGLKLPFGDSDEVGQDGTSNAPLEPSLQPGSGAVDAMVGFAYSRYLSAAMTLDTSVQYTYRSEANDFKIGDQILFGVATAYRFTESVLVFPQPSLFLELNVRHLFRNVEADEKIINSGGTVLFVSPGFRIGFSDRVAFTLAIQIPVYQGLNDEQQEALFKVSTGFTFTF